MVRAGSKFPRKTGNFIFSVSVSISGRRLVGISQHAINEEEGSVSVPGCSVDGRCNGLEGGTVIGSLGIFPV